ncbi:MAG TPA: transglutaminase-like cysteine peptidase [Sphingomicrobium sp.]
MRHPLLVRLAIGGAGLAGCLAVLSGVARAADSADYGQRPIIVSGSLPVVAPNVSGTLTIPVKPERYLNDWERARRDDSADPRMQALIGPARGLGREQQLSYVQSAVFQRIHWRSDATEWGAHDYWASAAETLEHGYGDEEDRAIVKMQALRALGFANRDLFLTMGRDKVGGPVTVLIVRLGERYYLLDDTGGAPLAADRRPEFTPMLSFGYGGFWIHGYRYVPGAPRSRTRVIVASARSAFAAH